MCPLSSSLDGHLFPPLSSPSYFHMCHIRVTQGILNLILTMDGLAFPHCENKICYLSKTSKKHKMLSILVLYCTHLCFTCTPSLLLYCCYCTNTLLHFLPPLHTHTLLHSLPRYFFLQCPLSMYIFKNLYCSSAKHTFYLTKDTIIMS